ncbi:MAG: LURP-one-related family protein [Oscillospiraceae bacterium]|nr:LURP-one-related family protein [Oscillospiraceae bacterium]
MKQKVFTWRDRFFIKDEAGNDRYSVVGEIFTFGKQLRVYDAGGTEVAFIRQKVFTFLPRFFVEINGREVCEIVKELTLLRQSYRLHGLPWHLHGDFWAHEYNLVEGDRQIMHMSKIWFTWGDSYEMDIAEPQNELMCLCIALAVDCVLAMQQAAAARR